MSMEQLNDYMGTAAALSSGAFLRGSNWPSVNAINTLRPIESVDTWDCGSIRFVTQVDATGEDHSKVSAEALSRLVSIAIIHRLQSSDLKDAYEYLVDSFYWNLKKSTHKIDSPVAVNSTTRKVKTFKSAPVALDE